MSPSSISSRGNLSRAFVADLDLSKTSKNVFPVIDAACIGWRASGRVGGWGMGHGR